MKYAVLDYETVGGKFNIGDYVQSLAARKYLPSVDGFVSREKLDSYEGEKVKLIMNGWFMHEPNNWPPAENIDPLFISFHINRPHLEKMLSPSSISYLKKHEPIGCRDYHTAEQLKQKGVNAYYSGCLTTTLPRPTRSNRQGVLFVDVMHAVPQFRDYIGMPLRYAASHIRSGSFLMSKNKRKRIQELVDLVPGELRDEIVFMENSIDAHGLDTSTRFKMAQEYLDKLANARLVFTSRIHCALPCLAFNTPVIFVKAGQKSLSNILRFHGVIDHMNVLDYDGDLARHGFKSNQVSLKDIDVACPPPNPDSFVELAEKMAVRCKGFIAK